MDELSAAVLEGGDIADSPADGQVDFLTLPVLDEDYGPEAIGDCEGEGVGREEKVHAGTENSGNDQERKVALKKGEVKCNLG